MEKKKTILVVEDENLNRKILNKILQEQYETLEAANGQEGWQLFLKNQSVISAVLLDVMMPVMDGYEFLEKIRANGIENIPIIVATGTTDSESERKVLAAGAWDFVSKPYNPEVLLSRLRNAIARSEVALFQQMQRMATHDALTGLHNRRKMFEQTQIMLDRHPELLFAFLRFDIDHFALFNTSFGEDEGNRLLIYLADCLDEMAKSVEYCKYCRMNSDVFCACFSYDGDSDHLMEYVDAMQKKLSDFKKDYLLSLSVGVYLVTDRHQSVDDLYFRATVAAKKCKNQYETHLAFYDAASGEKLAMEVEIQNEMQAALEKEQFLLYLQPRFSVATDTICGAEVLVRWDHPQKGMIFPGNFISVFEKNGFISKLDFYIWKKACAMLRKWTEQGKKTFPISVNVSRISLYNPNLTALLTKLVRDYQIDPSLLQLEITESAYMSDPELMAETIRSLHDAGFTILMDDFGSGFSSLNTLKRIYIDVLKVDMNFLPAEKETERGEIILACVIKMANLLGISVVTEGVETRQQRDFLEGVGCDCIQGYFYSHPITQEEYEHIYIDAVEQEILKPNFIGGLSKRHRPSILIIEDTKADRDRLVRILQDRYTVKMCEDGEQGLAYLKRNTNAVNLILVDDLTPGMTGLEFLKYCRMDNTLNAIPKIMIAAAPSVEEQVKAFEAGAYDYLEKPLEQEILLARVKHTIEISSRMFLYNAAAGNALRFAERDGLTGLLNRDAFQEITDRVLHVDKAMGSALLLIDVDNMKEINDQYGSLTGNKVLTCIAEELKKNFRKTDFIGRWDEEKFTVMMTQISGGAIAKKKAEESNKGILFSCLKQLNLDVSVSIGIVLPTSNDTQNTLFKKANQALNDAKRAGNARVVSYGENAPPFRIDNRPLILICSENPRFYSAIALSYGDGADFVSVTDAEMLRNVFQKYRSRIHAICLDMQKQGGKSAADFYRFFADDGEEREIPLLAFCQDGDMQQVREAMRMNITDLLFLPTNTDLLKNKVASAIMQAEALQRGLSEGTDHNNAGDRACWILPG